MSCQYLVTVPSTHHYPAGLYCNVVSAYSFLNKLFECGLSLTVLIVTFFKAYATEHPGNLLEFYTVNSLCSINHIFAINC
jgi:hypothetical protein